MRHLLLARLLRQGPTAQLPVPSLQSIPTTFRLLHARALNPPEARNWIRNISKSKRSSVRARNRTNGSSSRNRNRSTNGSRKPELTRGGGGRWSKSTSRKRDNWSKDRQGTSRGCKINNSQGT